MKILYHPEVSKAVKKLPRRDSARIIKVIELFEENSFYLTERHLKKLSSDLWELRAGRWRLLFGIYKNNAFIVDIFLKSTQKTPKKKLNLANKRFQLIK